MSFLAPFYIAGLLAVSLPIVFHLIRRTPRGRVLFSTMMFLEPSPPRITRRRRIDNWLLLALRALALCLLALAFARPFIRQAFETSRDAAEGKQVAILLDTSASMRRGNLWLTAVAQLKDVVSKTKAQDQIAIFTFDRDLKSVIGFDEWTSLQPSARTQLIEQRLANIAPGWSATHLGEALTLACGSFPRASETTHSDPQGKQKEIVLISDLQAGSRLVALQSSDWPDDVTLILQPLTCSDTTNAGLQFIAQQGLEDNEGGRPRVWITNAADSTREQFQIRWAGREQEKNIVAAYVPAGESRIVRAPKVPDADESLRLLLTGDDHDFDNSAYFMRPMTEKLNVLYYGNEIADDPQQPRYYIDRAFPETHRRVVQIITQDEDAPLTMPMMNDVHLVIATSRLSESHLKQIRRYVQSGGTLLYVTQTAADCSEIGRLLKIDDLKGREAKLDSYAMLTNIDFEHPIFAPLADPRFSDFTKLHIWKHRSLNEDSIPAARVLAQFDDGDPALIQIPFEKGIVLILTTSWHPSDSQLALSSKFVPLLNGILDFGLGRPEHPVRFTVGDPIPISRPENQQVTIKTPDDRRVQLASAQQRFAGTVVPGIYTVETEFFQKRFTVNVDADESKTAPFAIDKLEALGVKIGKQNGYQSRANGQRQQQLLSHELESRQRLWRWFIVAALAVLFLETWLGGRTARSAIGH